MKTITTGAEDGPLQKGVGWVESVGVGVGGGSVSVQTKQLWKYTILNEQCKTQLKNGQGIAYVVQYRLNKISALSGIRHLCNKMYLI